MKVQPYVSSEDGKLFDVSFNTDEVSFEILELTKDEVFKLADDFLTQVELLEKSYRGLSETPDQEENP